MHVFSVVFKWFIDVLDWATRQVLSLIGLRMMGEHLTVYTVEEIKHILSESEEGGVIQAPAREMLDAIFDLRDLVVRQVMIPRTEIIALESETPLPEIIQITTQSKYTKFPVYEENLDQILGILHVKDLLRAMQSPDFRELHSPDPGTRIDLRPRNHLRRYAAAAIPGQPPAHRHRPGRVRWNGWPGDPGRPARRDCR